MTTYNTRNPVPSADARDRYDNSQVFDELMNGQAPNTPDRLGVLRQSWAGMEQDFSGSQVDRAAAFQQFLDSMGWSSLGEYAAGVNIVSHTQTVDYQGQPYQLKPSVPASISAPYVTTGNWATEGANFKLVGDNSLRQDLALPSGANQVGFSAEESTETGTVGYELKSLDQKVQDMALTGNTACASDLRIAFHYNFENSPEKLERLKALGFNCVWVYRSAPWMGDTERTLTFLDSLYRHGICAIFQPSTPVITAGPGSEGYDAEIAWVSSIQGHLSLIGFSTWDEPVGQLASPAMQAAFYANIRTVTAKNIMCVDATHTLPELDANYYIGAGDVSLIDIYPTQNSSENAFKRYFTRAMLNLMSYDKGFARQTIPVLPLFSGEGFIEPTPTMARWMVECWRPFVRDRSYAAFAHDISAPGYKTIDNSQNLRELCGIVSSAWGGRGDFKPTLVTAKGVALNKSVANLTNIETRTLNGQGGRLIMGAATSADFSISIHVDVPRGARKVVLYSKFFNRYDALSRTFRAQVSVNGENFYDVHVESLGSANTGGDITAVYDLVSADGPIIFRFLVERGSTVIDGDYIGFYAVGAVPM